MRVGDGKKERSRSIGNFEMFVIDVEAIVSLEMMLWLVTSWVEPALMKVLADGLHIENVFGLLAKQAARFYIERIGTGKNRRSRC